MKGKDLILIAGLAIAGYIGYRLISGTGAIGSAAAQAGGGLVSAVQGVGSAVGDIGTGIGIGSSNAGEGIGLSAATIGTAIGIAPFITGITTGLIPTNKTGSKSAMRRSRRQAALIKAVNTQRSASQKIKSMQRFIILARQAQQ